MAVWGRIILKGVILYMRKYGSQDFVITTNTAKRCLIMRTTIGMIRNLLKIIDNIFLVLSFSFNILINSKIALKKKM